MDNPLNHAPQALSLRLLIVEDEWVVARDLKACLEALNYLVLDIVTTGEAALEEARSTRPDLILMDIHLDGAIDGITAAQQIWEALRIPSIFTTGYSDQATVDRALESEGMFGYILKPLRERNLYIAIQAALQRLQRLQTQQTQTQKSLSAEALSIVSAISDGVIVADAQGRVKFLNTMAVTLTGWSLVDAQKQPTTRVLPLLDLETQAPLEDLCAQVLTAQRSVYLVPVWLRQADRQCLAIAASAAPLRDHQNHLVGVIVVFRSVTDCTHSELTPSPRRLQLLEHQLQTVQTLPTQHEFLSEVSNQLQTPLNNVKLAVHLLGMNLDRRSFLANIVEQAFIKDRRRLEVNLELGTQQNTTAANLSVYLHGIRTECDQELHVVNQLLAMQRLDAGQTAVQWQSLHLVPWLREQLAPYTLRATVREQHLLWLVNGLPFTDRLIEPLQLVTDPLLLANIVGELLTNACQYTPPGGAITVCLDSAQHSRTVQLSVSNTNTTLPPDALPRLFDKFYRVPSHEHWQQGGTGLGLALVKRQVAYLDGQLSVTNTAGLLTFTVTLSLIPPTRSLGHL